jgi:hypothetical protein
MKKYLEKFNYTTSKSAIERHAILKRISKKYDFEYLLEIITLKIKRTPPNQINNIRILRADLKWVEKFKS